jgi:uroporphyrinogen-III decarboxylase
MVSLQAWADGEGIDFTDEAAVGRYRERTERMMTVLEGGKPDRVPVHLMADFLAGHLADVSFEAMLYEPERTSEAYRHFVEAFDPDFNPIFPVPSGRVFDRLGYRVYDWPGDGLGPDSGYQANEAEYMKAEDYDELIANPDGFFLRRWYPRAFEALEGFEQFPLFSLGTEMGFGVTGFVPFGMEPLQEALEALQEAGEEALAWQRTIGQVSMEANAQGYPSIAGGLTKAPFDVIGDTLRGTREIMIDMRKRPEKVKAAAEALVPEMVKLGASNAEATGVPFVWFVLHKGADSFMSKDDYREFYWPTLRAVMEELMDRGIVPWMFAEGSYEDRLDIIAEDQPEGPVIWHFDQTDMGLAKEKLGEVATIAGNVPTGVIKTGDPEKVRTYCENLIETAGPDGFVLTPGATVYRAPEENLHAIVDSVQ